MQDPKEKLGLKEEHHFPPKLELDSNSDSANHGYYKHFGQHEPKTSQGQGPHRPSFVGAQAQFHQPQSATHQAN